ncbi:regulatory signaling modulator protein AmpE [Gilvimarinus sp. DA14]|uniref:regulatory signaling modulator protein AmpE n=1 Tax=Gilvimarinus sp. DA14 TaxID=2956798 RepID=UPI0020B7806E|nr:regulatory signaling modulator protein AmpE [Gilvimarinus sp. DA14]UTF59665.1 regulatory signaling modulator protein AmpE [Gilvimarinus sp. DA14]
MTFLSLVIVLLLVQWWGSGRPLQKDAWLLRFWLWLDSKANLPLPLKVFLAVATPVVVVVLLVAWVHGEVAGLWLLLINIAVLLYSLGRGKFSEPLQEYIAAAHSDQSVRATHIVDEMNLDPQLRSEMHEEDWLTLNHDALRVFSYRGFERMFAVLFWFLLLGAPGALAYRLLIILWSQMLETNHKGAPLMTKVVTWIEWPAACLMGLSWALVGNFDACVKPLRQGVTNASEPTPVYLARVLRGALGEDIADDQKAATNTATQTVKIEPAYSLSLVEQIGGMFSRALLLWVVLAAVATLIF